MNYPSDAMRPVEEVEEERFVSHFTSGDGTPKKRPSGAEHKPAMLLDDPYDLNRLDSAD